MSSAMTDHERNLRTLAIQGKAMIEVEIIAREKAGLGIPGVSHEGLVPVLDQAWWSALEFAATICESLAAGYNAGPESAPLQEAAQRIRMQASEFLP